MSNVGPVKPSRQIEVKYDYDLWRVAKAAFHSLNHDNETTAEINIGTLYIGSIRKLGPHRIDFHPNPEIPSLVISDIATSLEELAWNRKRDLLIQFYAPSKKTGAAGTKELIPTLRCRLSEAVTREQNLILAWIDQTATDPDVLRRPEFADPHNRFINLGRDGKYIEPNMTYVLSRDQPMVIYRRPITPGVQ